MGQFGDDLDQDRVLSSATAHSGEGKDSAVKKTDFMVEAVVEKIKYQFLRE
jgi:3-hydroxyacyl-CoA dehydrogenase